MEYKKRRSLILILFACYPWTFFGQNSPPGGISLIGENFISSFKLYSGSAEATKKEKSITGQPFGRIVELRTKKKTANFWGAEYSTPIANPVKKKRGCVASFLHSMHILTKTRFHRSRSGLLPKSITRLG